MNRLIRIGSVLLCIVSAILFFLSGLYIKRNTDTNPPQIKMDKEEIEVSINASQEELLKGVTAVDKKDGDVSNTLIIESMSLFTQPGKRSITIDAYDKNHNVVKTERIIRYTDYHAPRVRIKNPLRASLNDINQILEYIRVEDCLDGDITDSLQITFRNGDTNISLPGEYKIKLTVSNSAGDVVELPLILELYDYAADVGQAKALLSEYLVYTKVGQPINPQDYLIGIELRENQYLWSEYADSMSIPYAKGEVTVEEQVDYNTTGVYEIHYLLKNTSGYTTKIRMFVVVEE